MFGSKQNTRHSSYQPKDNKLVEISGEIQCMTFQTANIYLKKKKKN